MIILKRSRRIATIVVCSIVVVSGLIFVLSTGHSNPVSIEFSSVYANASGEQVAKARFRSLTQKTYIGWFVTDVFVGNKWIESTSQRPETRQAMSVLPNPTSIYEMPVPRERTEWRVRWTGQTDYGQVSSFRKWLEKFLDRPSFRDKLHIRFMAAPVIVAVGSPTINTDF
jgi:hypothetical protein